MRLLSPVILILTLLSFRSTTKGASGPSTPTVDAVCLSEILIGTPQPYQPAQVADAQRKADVARESIRQGAKFEEIARRYSDGPSAMAGGALGAFKRGQLAKTIEDTVFAMNPGDVSGVIRTKQGFVILKVENCNIVTGLRGPSDTIEVLGHTQGIVGPYVRRIRRKIEENWYSRVPLSAEKKSGDVTIEFTIAKEGKVENMHVVAGSGDDLMDRAAWEGITRSNPFPPLPNEFSGPYLSLRFHFFYNPDKNVIQ